MECSAINFGVILHEKVFLGDSPLSFANVFVGLGILLRCVFPTEQSTILADCEDLFNSIRRSGSWWSQWVSSPILALH